MALRLLRCCAGSRAGILIEHACLAMYRVRRSPVRVVFGGKAELELELGPGAGSMEIVMEGFWKDWVIVSEEIEHAATVAVARRLVRVGTYQCTYYLPRYG